MFFTVSSVKNVLVYLHDCKGRNKELIDQLKKDLEGYKVAWISDEMNKWWQALGIADSDVFVAGSRVEARLLQNVMRKAMAAKKMKRQSTIIVTSYPEILGMATQLLLGTVYLEIDSSVKDERPFGTDFSIRASSLGEVLTGSSEGYASEYFSAPNDCCRTSKDQAVMLAYGQVKNKETDTKDYYGGRYFSSKDSRHDLHPLSLRIIDSKKNDRQAQVFKEAFAFLIKVATKGNFDYISHVPAKPGERDRFIKFLENIHQNAELKGLSVNKSQVRDDLLVCTKKYPSLKNFGAIERKEIIAGVFKAESAVKTKRIVLLDDVRTTGTTLTECIKTLLDAGASEVIPITLAYKPLRNFVLPAMCDTPPYTACCDWPAVIRFNKSGEPFYGCSAWHGGDGVTHKSASFFDIRKQMQADSDDALLELDIELDADVEY